MSNYRMTLALAGKKTKAASAAARVGVPEVSEVHEEEPLQGVSFASDAARALAEEEGLSWRDFASSTLTPTSWNGYTKRDVQKILAGSKSDAAAR